MRLVRFQRYRYTGLGALHTDGRVIDLAAAAAAWLSFEQGDPHWEHEVRLRLPDDLGQFLAAGRPSRELVAAAIAFASRVPTPPGIAGEPLLLTMNEIQLVQLLRPPLILSSGAHFKGEHDAERREHREFFVRNPHNLLGPADDIALPGALSEHFEIAPRLGVIIGDTLRNVAPAEVAKGVFGYCPVLELCARDLESISWAGPMFHVQYPHARTFDGSLLLGAPVVAKKEVDDIAGRGARLAIDDCCIFDGAVPGRWAELADWICELSQVVTLQPGTLLIPGAADDTIVREVNGAEPAAITAREPTPRELLRIGAAVTLDIEGVGRIETRIGRPR